MTKELIKQDLNFMENPLWFQDERLAESCLDGFVWKDNGGYLYRAGYKPPVKTDIIFLLYLLLQSQKNQWSSEVTLTRYQILTDCGLDDSKYWYDRLEDSLRRWKMIGIEFKGSFFDGKKYTAMNFGIIDSWIVEEKTKELKIVVSPLYLQKIKETTFFRYLNFEEVKALHSPLATRVYEIVVKMFQGRSFWETDCVKFAHKIPMNEKYPADIIPKIKTAVNRINGKTSLKLKLHVRPNGRGKSFIGFEKLPANTTLEIQPPVTSGLPETDEFKQIVMLIPPPENTKKTILEAVARSFKKHGFQYTVRNIRYTTRQAKKNYRAYLDRALKEDLGRGWAEDLEANQKMERIRTAEREAADLKRQQEAEALHRKEKQTMDLIAALSLEERQILEPEAIARLEAEGANRRFVNKVVIDLKIADILREREKEGAASA